MSQAAAKAGNVLIWLVFVAAIAVPTGIAFRSPLLAWRDPTYILAGFAGIAAFVILLCQPLLIRGHLPGMRGVRGRKYHRIAGVLLVTAVVVHVAGLWITSPPDVVDVLLFASPTPFGVWGAIAMWAVFATAMVAAWRRRLLPRIWRVLHGGLAVVIVFGSVAHAVLIDGTMGFLSKLLLCSLILLANLWALRQRQTYSRPVKRAG